MKMSMSWRSNKQLEKKKRVRSKPKIRWQQLGLSDPAEKQTAMSIDEIRRQVLMLSSRGLGQGVRARPNAQRAEVNAIDDHAEPGRKRRRGATE